MAANSSSNDSEQALDLVPNHCVFSYAMISADNKTFLLLLRRTPFAQASDAARNCSPGNYGFRTSTKNNKSVIHRPQKCEQNFLGDYWEGMTSGVP